MLTTQLIFLLHALHSSFGRLIYLKCRMTVKNGYNIQVCARLKKTSKTPTWVQVPRYLCYLLLPSQYAAGSQIEKTATGIGTNILLWDVGAS